MAIHLLGLRRADRHHNVHSRPGPGANEEQRRLAVTRFPAGQAA